MKTVESLKDELGLVNLHFLSHSRLARQVLHFETRNPGLEPKEVATHVDKHRRILLYYIPCVILTFKRIKKGSSYYRRIITQKNPFGRPTYKDKMEKRFDISLKRGYVNKVTDLMNSGTIPVGNSNILHQLILGKTKLGKIIKALV